MSDWHDLYEGLYSAAEKLRVGFAYNRKTFKERLGEHLKGAIGEYYKARIAEANGINKYVQHWDTEVWQLLDRFMQVYSDDVKGFADRKKAAFEVLNDVRKKDVRYQQVAYNALSGRYGFAVKPVDLQEASDLFFSGVENKITSLMARVQASKEGVPMEDYWKEFPDPFYGPESGPA